MEYGLTLHLTYGVRKIKILPQVTMSPQYLTTRQYVRRKPYRLNSEKGRYKVHKRVLAYKFHYTAYMNENIIIIHSHFSILGRIEYSEYAEISAPSSNVSYHNASPYATSSILMNNDINAYQHQSNMYLNSDVESYYNGRNGGRSIDGGSSGGGSTYRDKLTITENKLASTHNLVPGATTHLMMYNTMDVGGNYQRQDQMYQKVGEATSWNRSHQPRLKDPDIIYAPSAAINRNVISFLNKKDFRDDV